MPVMAGGLKIYNFKFEFYSFVELLFQAYHICQDYASRAIPLPKDKKML